MEEGQSHHRRKIRPIKSCMQCRSRRVKCDQARPSCSECRRIRRTCHYGEGGGEGSLSAPIAGLLLQESTSQQTQYADASSVDLSGTEDLGYMSLSTGGRSRYVGPSFWGISSKNEPDFRSFLLTRDHNSVADIACFCFACNSSTVAHDHFMRQSIGNLRMHDSLHSLEQVLAYMPSKEVCDRLLVIFLNSVYPILPVLHLPTFFHQYDGFWEDVGRINQGLSPTGVLGVCPSFLALLLSCLFCGSLGESATDTRISGTDTATQSISLRDLTTQALAILHYPRDPTLYSLLAFVTSHLPLIREESERSVTFITVAVRSALALGLHRDPKHFEELPKVEAEIRRRLWHHIIHKDTLSCLSSGLPPLVFTSKQYDTAKMSEIGGPDDGVPHVDCRQRMCNAKFLITDTMRVILQRQCDTKPWSLADVEHSELLIANTAKQIHSMVPTRVFPATPNESEDFEDTRHASVHYWTMEVNKYNRVFIEWSSKAFDMGIEKLYCSVYQPLQKQIDNSPWEAIRDRAIVHYHSYLQMYINQCTEPLYGPYQWVYPGSYQPIQAISVLLADLATKPDSPEAAVSRRLLDKTFSLLGHEGVVAEEKGRLKQRRLSASGREAWRLLWALRRSTWLNAKLDPDALWACARPHEEPAPLMTTSQDDLYGDDSEDNQNLDLGLPTDFMSWTIGN